MTEANPLPGKEEATEIIAAFERSAIVGAPVLVALARIGFKAVFQEEETVEKVMQVFYGMPLPIGDYMTGDEVREAARAALDAMSEGWN